MSFWSKNALATFKSLFALNLFQIETFNWIILKDLNRKFWGKTLEFSSSQAQMSFLKRAFYTKVWSSSFFHSFDLQAFVERVISLAPFFEHNNFLSLWFILFSSSSSLIQNENEIEFFNNIIHFYYYATTIFTNESSTSITSPFSAFSLGCLRRRCCWYRIKRAMRCKIKGRINLRVEQPRQLEKKVSSQNLFTSNLIFYMLHWSKPLKKSGERSKRKGGWKASTSRGKLWFMLLCSVDDDEGREEISTLSKHLISFTNNKTRIRITKGERQRRAKTLNSLLFIAHSNVIS